MVIYSRFFKNSGTGVYFDDIENINITMTTSDNNTASQFKATVPNEFGRHKTDFDIGDEIKIYVDQDINPPTTNIFTGTVESIDFSDKDSVKNTMTLTGRDYSSLLQNVTIEPSVYNNLEAGSIVKSLVTEFCSGLSIGSVANTGYTVNHISFNHSPVYDGIMQLAGYTNHMFYVDESKNVVFQPKGEMINTYTLGSANVLTAKFQNTNRKLFNQIWVYGDRVLSTAPLESFTSNGIGSVMTLQYKPHNIEVRASGTTIVKGAVFNMNSSPSSGTAYMVDYDQQKIIWVSGTDLGNNIPASGTVSNIYYDRSLPIIKYIQDNTSVSRYGPSAKIIQDKNIKDPRQATDIAKAQLTENAYPREQGTVKVQGIAPLMPNTQTPIYLPFHNVSGAYNIYQVQYDLNKINCLADAVMTASVGEKIPDVTDTLKQAILDLRRLQVGDISQSDILTRIETSIGSMGLKVKSWTLNTQGIGSDWYVGSPASVNGWVGSPGSYYAGSHATSWTYNQSGGEL